MHQAMFIGRVRGHFEPHLGMLTQRLRSDRSGCFRSLVKGPLVESCGSVMFSSRHPLLGGFKGNQKERFAIVLFQVGVQPF